MKVCFNQIGSIYNLIINMDEVVFKYFEEYKMPQEWIYVVLFLLTPPPTNAFDKYLDATIW